MHRNYEQIVENIIRENPDFTARFVHDELQDRTNWSSKTCPSIWQVRYIMRRVRSV